MAITMYSGFVPVCLQLLGGLKTVLQKAEEHATAQKWDTADVAGAVPGDDGIRHHPQHRRQRR